MRSCIFCIRGKWRIVIYPDTKFLNKNGVLVSFEDNIPIYNTLREAIRIVKKFYKIERKTQYTSYNCCLEVSEK